MCRRMDGEEHTDTWRETNINKRVTERKIGKERDTHTNTHTHTYIHTHTHTHTHRHTHTYIHTRMRNIRWQSSYKYYRLVYRINY